MKKHPSVQPCITCTSRAASPRTGHEHVYTLNGSRLRDVVVDGQWLTVSVSDPVPQRAAA
ncbi:hypothetical protein LMG28688_06862 [Paraburkholderia caffeinitolerans]|uniref:Uncharacterized protein n=1 Tax=Paraburkholderia caffeinitolerans TaxID=1723730 RepID=A0A6J5H4J9_9BURK|nr:hypothetical protein [Paraburkholderia caffeinitolerans]CAB3808849.1 hypothetical protein LMG28688_06862 [Paraburkholderia caffeinitolerans]